MTTTPQPSDPPPELSYSRKVLIAVAISVAALLLTAFVYYTAQILVLVFAGILFSVFLSAPSDLLAKHARIGRTYALGIVVGTLFLIVTLGGYFMGYTVYKQGVELSRTLPGAMKQLEVDLHKYLPAPRNDDPASTAPATLSATSTAPTTPPDSPTTWLADKIHQIRESASDFFTSPSFVKGAGGVVSTTFGLLGNLVVVFGVGLFFAMAPATYTAGFLRIVPVTHRPRFALVMSEIGGKLQWWFVGTLCSMITVGTLVFIGLSILGVPMAFTLAILACVLNFVPYVGPLLAAAPAILIAFAPHGDQTALNPALAGWTMLLYFVIQMLDGWVFTPFYQKRAVNIPPALIILAQIVISLLLGPIGLILATPILATVLVLVRAIYIEDILGDIPALTAAPARERPAPSVPRV